MKAKSKKTGIVGIAIAAVCTVVALVANILVGIFNGMIMLYFRGETKTSVEMTETQALENARKLTEQVEGEGLVLLKNDGALPLKETKKINLFGNCSYQTLYQGSGSASSWFKQDINITMKQGFENAGFEVNPGLWKFYADHYQERNDQAGGTVNMTGADASILEQTMEQYQSYTYEGKNILDYSEQYSDTAVMVIGRAGGEGSDAKLDMTGITGGDAGKHYLELQQVEINLLDYLKEHYEKVIILLNTPNPMEVGFLEDSGIDACIWMGLPGSTGNNAVAKVISGEVTPSGHLPDTWAYQMESNPTYYNFGNYEYSNFTDPLGHDRNRYVYYNEGIYVGYRYYETAAAEGYINFAETVQYPFGYGLSYTSFEWSNPQWTVGGKGGTISVSVTVKNVGTTYSGKDVVQLYYHAPYTASEGIEKSEVVLGGFAKTKLLAPGESNIVTITMNYDDMASYDYKTEKAYVLSAGKYELTLRSDSHTVKDGCSHSFDADRIVYNEANGGRSSDVKAATNLYDDVTAGDGSFGVIAPLMTRSDFAGTFPTGRDQCANATANQTTIERMGNSYAGSDIDIAKLDQNHPGVGKPVMGADNGLIVTDMIGLDYDDPLWEDLLDQLTLNELRNMFGNCGWHNPAVVSIEKAMAVDMDGAEGLHNLTNDKTGNQYTGTVVLAATWNQELAAEFGRIFADECLVEGVSGLYAPSMNTHRNPFGGRAFEYYSEDGLLAGKLAAAQIREMQKKGIAVYIKHYMLNDQETNRQRTVHTWATEQTIREIYARPFEISVKEASATGFMAGYNAIGATWTGASYATMSALPRGEWGFKGRILTDACDDYITYSSDAAVVAGVDMWLTAMKAEVSSKITDSAYGLQCLRRAAHNQLYVFANSAAVQMEVQWNYSWIAIVVAFDVLLVAGIVCSAVFMIYPAFFAKKTEKE
ncbi:MAG: glycoside hydrolase family 3 protein [Clostridia bacterium]|nr:glycoside hydrolase family 3 protein [Clostridia bacterium]